MINRILTMLRSGRVTLVDDSGPVQRVQIDEGSLGAVGGRRILDKVMKLGHFGFASIPPIGSEALLAAPNGERTHTMVIGTNHQPSRPRDMKPGDAAMYDVRGAKVELTESGLVIDCAGLPAVVRNFSGLRVEGDIHVTGDVISRADGTPVSLNGLRDAYVAHKHPVSAVGSPTGVSDHLA